RRTACPRRVFGAKAKQWGRGVTSTASSAVNVRTNALQHTAIFHDGSQEVITAGVVDPLHACSAWRGEYIMDHRPTPKVLHRTKGASKGWSMNDPTFPVASQRTQSNGQTPEQRIQTTLERVERGGAPKYHTKNAETGKLFARERIARLCDPGSFIEDAALANA